MVSAELAEALVESVRKYVVIMVGWRQRSVADGLQLKGTGHAPQFEIPKEEVGVAEPGVLACPVQTLID
jgi:hypothetical protein